MKLLLKFSFCMMAAFTLQGQCVDELWHNSSAESNWLSCTSRPNPLTELGNSHWILYRFAEARAIESIRLWNLSHPNLVTAGVKNLRVDYSPDGATWRQLDIFILEPGENNKEYTGQLFSDFEIIEAEYILFTALSTHGNPCAGLAEVKFNIGELTTPTQDIELSRGINIAPNPADQYIKISFDNIGPTNLQLELYDLMGRKIYEQRVNTLVSDSEFDIESSSLQDGQYTLRIFGDNGFASKKIVVVHPR